MLKLCRISTVGLHFLLLTHIAHSFVLLTANVDDVKKIARKFVSESLAEKIVDFIAKATKDMGEDSIKKNAGGHRIAKNMGEERPITEEKKDEGSSEVSTENRMYNVDRAANYQSEDIIKTAEEADEEEEIVLGKETISLSKNVAETTEKKKHRATNEEYTSRKPKKPAPKPLHRRSRYIEEKAEKTEKPNTKINEEHVYKNMKEPAVKFVEDDEDISSTSLEAKSKQNSKKSEKRKELYSGTESAEAVAADIDKDDGPKSEDLPTETENDPKINEDKNVTEKAVIELQNRDIVKNQETGQVSTPITGKNEFDTEYNNVIPTEEKVQTSGPSVKDKEDEKKWWEKELPTQNQDVKVQSKGKSWF